jgi:hypothetical protein
LPGRRGRDRAPKMFICMGLAFWKAIGIVETVLQSVNKWAIFGLFLKAANRRPACFAVAFP